MWFVGAAVCRSSDRNAVLRLRCCWHAGWLSLIYIHFYSPQQRRAALARRNSLPAGTASHTEDQPVTS